MRLKLRENRVNSAGLIPSVCVCVCERDRVYMVVCLFVCFWHEKEKTSLFRRTALKRRIFSEPSRVCVELFGDLLA